MMGFWPASGESVVRWRRSRAHAPEVHDRQPLVLTVTEPLTRDTAPDLVARVGRIATSSRIVIDLTAIPDFDSEGAAAIVGLQESYGADRLTVVGMRQATSRIIGIDDLALTATSSVAVDSGWVVRELRAIAVVQAEDNRQVSTDDLEPVLESAIA